jgi:hypothetical protein
VTTARELRVEALDRVDEARGVVDRIVALVRRAGVGRAAVDLDLDVAVAAAADDRLQLGRLGHDRLPRGEPRTLQQRADAGAALLLVDHRGERDRRLDPGALQSGHGDHCRGDPRLHVGGAAPIHAPVLEHSAERVARPTLARRHSVGVDEEQQTALPGPERRVDVGPPGRDLVQLGLETKPRARLGQEACDRRLAARRVRARAAHEPLQQLGELVAIDFHRPLTLRPQERDT